MRGNSIELIDMITGLILFSALFAWLMFLPVVGLLWMMGWLS